MAKSRGKKPVAKKTAGRKRSTVVPATKFKVPIKFPPLKDGHVWDTARLRVYLQTITTPDENTARIFSGWMLDCSPPRPLVTVVVGIPLVFIDGDPPEAFVDWLVTDEEYRRQGLATELLQSIESRWGRLRVSGTTESGDAFAAAFHGAIKASQDRVDT